VPGAAEALGIEIGEHSVTIARASAAVACIEQRLDELRRDGGLRAFNALYAMSRRKAQQRGEPFPSYGAAVTKLHRALADVGAGQPLPAFEYLLGDDAGRPTDRAVNR
jgi:hypothetical protein